MGLLFHLLQKIKKNPHQAEQISESNQKKNSIKKRTRRNKIDTIIAPNIKINKNIKINANSNTNIIKEK